MFALQLGGDYPWMDFALHHHWPGSVHGTWLMQVHKCDYNPLEFGKTLFINLSTLNWTGYWNSKASEIGPWWLAQHQDLFSVEPHARVADLAVAGKAMAGSQGRKKSWAKSPLALSVMASNLLVSWGVPLLLPLWLNSEFIDIVDHIKYCKVSANCSANWPSI